MRYILAAVLAVVVAQPALAQNQRGGGFFELGTGTNAPTGFPDCVNNQGATISTPARCYAANLERNRPKLCEGFSTGDGKFETVAITLHDPNNARVRSIWCREKSPERTTGNAASGSTPGS